MSTVKLNENLTIDCTIYQTTIGFPDWVDVVHINGKRLVVKRNPDRDDDAEYLLTDGYV